jgi:tRNA threonylcarbamoyladenosine biosynthesis protein TsaE
MPELMLPELVLRGADATEAAGAALAKAVDGTADSAALRIYLRGELGAGKTTFTRGFLRGLGHAGRVPSPTYTLVEPYELVSRRVWHLDLYRLGDGAELEYLGLDEMDEAGSVLLIEWPERGEGYLPSEDLSIELKVNSDSRLMSLAAYSSLGEELLSSFEKLAANSAGL